jgi:hypothetical protein
MGLGCASCREVQTLPYPSQPIHEKIPTVQNNNDNNDNTHNNINANNNNDNTRHNINDNNNNNNNDNNKGEQRPFSPPITKIDDAEEQENLF